MYLLSFVPVAHKRPQYHEAVFHQSYFFQCIWSFQKEFSSSFELDKSESMSIPFTDDMLQFYFDILFFNRTDADVLCKN